MSGVTIPIFKPSAILCLSLLIAACGGGGGGESTGSQAPTTPQVPAGFSVSGTVLLSQETRVDLDTADVGSEGGRNDTDASAQAIPNPVVLGAYLGGSDQQDVYAVDLLASQQVRVEVFAASGSFIASGLRVELVDRSDLQVVDTLVALRDAGAVTVPVTQSGSVGAYFVRVSSTGENLSYVLRVGEAISGTAAPFMPGEVLILQDTARASLALPGRWTKRFPGMSDRAERSLQRASGSLQAGLLQLDGQRMRGVLRQRSNAAFSSEMDAESTLRLIKALRARPDILFAEPNYIRRRSNIADNPFFANQWHYPLINLPAAWDVPGADGQGVVVAVLDTGILPDHPDLIGQTGPDGYDFVSSSVTSLDGDGLDPDPTDPGDNTAGNSSFHGTHVAGTIAAANNSLGGLGVAYNAQLMPLRVLGRDGAGTDADLIQAMLYAAGLPNDSGTVPSRRADIVNMSLGGAASSQALENAVESLNASGVIMVAAAGNGGSNQPFYPAAYPQVISVGAVSADRSLAPYSNFGSTVSLVAPGGNLLLDQTGDGLDDGVLSTWADDSSGLAYTYALAEGTSMAAPHVSGVLALMAGLRDPSDPLRPSQVKSLLESGALTIDLGSPGRDDLFGYGLLDATRALAAIEESTLPVLEASPARLSFSSAGLQSALITLTLPAPEDGSISNILASASTTGDLGWLAISGPAGDSSAPEYTVSIDQTGLRSDVTYAGSLSFSYDATQGAETAARELLVPVSLTMFGDDDLADAGQHFVLLYDPDTAETLFQESVSASSTGYEFEFSELPAGDYLLAAGSDLDNDGLICDAGEACGIYPVRNLPEILTLSEDLENIDFTTGFEAQLQSAENRSFFGPEGLPRLH